MISLSSLNTVVTEPSWRGNNRPAEAVARLPQTVTQQTYQKPHAIRSNEEVLQGEVLPKVRHSQQPSTQSILQERTLANAKPIMASGSPAHETVRSFSQVSAYQMIEGANYSYAESGNTAVDVYI